ncbi:Anoctamin-5 [Hypsibius exemplaris]|uniref:Anoctamin n=1 Tax=Hypsibius exemplaris TaxID=2072580 RepID=A0A1W0WQ19_HYPEX|nr:Anoctamin-5 [Hypsibius exemplaris]
MPTNPKRTVRNTLNVEEGVPLHDQLKPRKSLKYGLSGDEESLFFNDGRRRIDFVLVYQTGSKASDVKKTGKRANFQDQMEQQGIDFELHSKEVPGEGPDVQLCFVKLHATWDLLIRYADIMKIRMPLMKAVRDEYFQDDQISRHCPNPLKVDATLLPKLPQYVSTGFSKSKIGLFNIPDKESFFSPSLRSRIIWECLTRIQFAQSNPSRIGIQKLLADGSFLAAFPLHDGPWEPELNRKPSNLRASLYDQWGRFKMWFKFQPIDYIKNYFGERMGFYFAWMEFYTLMLLPAMIVGLICIIYGLASVGTHIPVNELCLDKEIGDIVMCPICERRCPYWFLKESCTPAKATYLIDNPATICFATFMALWSSLFLILWKRKQTILSWNFDTYYVTEQEEPVRPELEAQIKPDKWKINPVTQVNEPYVSPWRRMLQSMVSGSVIIFMIIVVFAAVFGTVVYRTSLNVAIYASALDAPDSTGDESETFQVKYSVYIVGGTAALINLIVILILNSVYYRIAKWLTEKEYPRTQSEYENSLTVKYYIFEFVNTYTSLFYVAFFKGRVPPPLPGAKGVFNLPADRCDKGGCLIELTIQLAVLFLGSGFVNFVLEMIIPSISRALRNRQHLRIRQRMKFDFRWEKDYDLHPYPGMNMFMEYSRMVTQFGFITMFVAAFPLAPIFALISNLLEIRLDAYKYLTLHRRPVATWARDIGAWGKILENVARFAVITNGFIIAFSSDFVPKLAYVSAYSEDYTLTGYTKWSLSEFSADDFPFGSAPEIIGLREWNPDYPPKTCFYKEFRSGPERPRPYALNLTFWHIFAARVILVLVFEHFVMLATKLVSFFVPDIPASLKVKVLRENFLAKEAFYEAEGRKKGNDGGRGEVTTPV